MSINVDQKQKFMTKTQYFVVVAKFLQLNMPNKGLNKCTERAKCLKSFLTCIWVANFVDICYSYYR